MSVSGCVYEYAYVARVLACGMRVSYPVRVQGVSWLCCVYIVGVCKVLDIQGEMAGKAIPTPILIREMKQLLE